LKEVNIDYVCKKNIKFWEELIAHFPLKGNGSQRKCVQNVFVAEGRYLPSYWIAAIGQVDTRTDIL
jgi:hypothetical protein